MKLLLTLFMIPFLGAALPAAALRVIDETAIPYMAFLSKADFDQRFPGERIASPAQLQTGWYVIYEHQALNYYFGPILLQSTGEDYLGQLSKTVKTAVAERPSIQNYRLELSYEPQLAGSGANRAEPPSAYSKPDARPPQPESPSGIWGFIKKIFGFG